MLLLCFDNKYGALWLFHEIEAFYKANWFPRSSVGIHTEGTSGSGMRSHARARERELIQASHGIALLVSVTASILGQPPSTGRWEIAYRR